jgi:hypothetical protein
MTWKKARASDVRETVLKCDATSFRDITTSLTELIARMESNWLADGFPKAEAIFIDINSTNGHLMVSWDIKGGGGAFCCDDNWPTFYLELKALWQESESHADGAHHFDRQAHFAICSVAEDILIAAEEAGQPEPYEVYELFEGSANGSQRVMV